MPNGISTILIAAAFLAAILANPLVAGICIASSLAVELALFLFSALSAPESTDGVG